MQRNVVAQLSRPRLRPFTSPSAHQAQLRNYSDPPPNANLTTQTSELDNLRKADQTSLTTTTIAANNLKRSIHNLQTATNNLPTTLANPSIPHSTYTLSTLRHKTQTIIPPWATTTLNAITHAQTHLQDLAAQAYTDIDADTGRDVLRRFELEISGWTHEEKEDLLRSWSLEEEARRKRLNEASLRLVKFVKEVLGGDKTRDIRAPAFEKGSGKEDGGGRKGLVAGEEEIGKGKVRPKVMAAANSAAKAPSSPSLKDLQKQLEASVSGKK